MAYLVVSECRVSLARMQEFTAQVQHWEQDALRHPSAPRHHAVYLSAGDPARVLVISEFDSRDAATDFEEAGLLAAFRDAVLRCVAATPETAAGFDLFYAATPDGPAVTFGETTHPKP